MTAKVLLAGAAVAAGSVLASGVSVAQHVPAARHDRPAASETEASAKSPGVPAPIRTTMERLHESGGVPPGWSFLVPPGDPAQGRRVFIELNCSSCHDVKGEQLPESERKPGNVGPELTGMGGHHPAAYFAESIMNPNRVIVEGPGYTGPDGLSKMPDYSESMTVRQLIDLVAYLTSLTPPSGEHGAMGAMPMPRATGRPRGE